MATNSDEVPPSINRAAVSTDGQGRNATIGIRVPRGRESAIGADGGQSVAIRAVDRGGGQAGEGEGQDVGSIGDLDGQGCRAAGFVGWVAHILGGDAIGSEGEAAGGITCYFGRLPPREEDEPEKGSYGNIHAPSNLSKSFT